MYTTGPLISFHQGNTWSGKFVVQNVPLEAVLLDKSKVSSCSIYFGISIISGGLASTFLTLPCMVAGSLPSVLPCWSMVLFHGGSFQGGTAVHPKLGWRLGKERCQSCLCPVLSPVSWEQGEQPLPQQEPFWDNDLIIVIFSVLQSSLVFSQYGCIELSGRVFK